MSVPLRETTVPIPCCTYTISVYFDDRLHNYCSEVVVKHYDEGGRVRYRMRAEGCDTNVNLAAAGALLRLHAQEQLCFDYDAS